MAYTKTNWINDSVPAINAGNLNKIEQGIYDNSIATEENTDNIGDLDNLTTQNKSDLVNAINSIVDSEVYSTDEVKTNKVWIDGKPIYRKVINVGNLPNNTNKSVASGVNFNNAMLVKMYGVCKHSSSNVSFPLPFANPSTLGYSIMLNMDNSNNIIVTTGTDRTGYYGYVIIEYTKTTD